MIPGIAKRKGAIIIEINRDRSLYTDYITDIFLQGKAGEILPKLKIRNQGSNHTPSNY